ncbi:AAA family ATPase [Deinococcus cellulosilyticus]|uniref:ATP-binding protein n=1 Tax=Deinococcus cellulosilyticus (strain DSM 18568 / NBRC 106333 / KACC 11606 / 5516J-15) TaxID=1223518 RepID=A0A511MXP9_DEIC1|nr:ATP-binding protein [Deinococcus cellulosilyticus]GEM44927.1 hypothetical protein DC3_05620 [Deinococcus cellulosilyticus NBRC 106333 = KACC 11606]
MMNWTDMSTQPTLYLMCGLPGAGKTTRAREIEQTAPALRLTPDEWMVPLFGEQHSTPELLRARDTIEGLLFELAERALKLGINVVVDYGVWSRTERETFRARARAAGAKTELIYLDVPIEELKARVEARNRNLDGKVYPITKEEMDLWATWFERPAPEELIPD